MKNNFKFLAVAAVGLAIGLSVNNFAVSDVPSNYKVAVIDVKKVVEGSKQFAAAKADKDKQVAEFIESVKKAKTEIAAEKDANKRKSLEEKHAKDLNNKKAAIEKNYSTKLLALDKSITSVVNTKTKEGNYNLVLYKSSVIAGGEDITSAVSAALK